MELDFTTAAITCKDGAIWLALKVTAPIKAKKFAAEMQKDKPYTAQLHQKRTKRSLDANAYFWTLCGKLAAKIGIAATEIYRTYIREIGDNFEITPVRLDAAETWIKNWQSRGIGWVCQNTGSSKIPGYVNIVNYYGSSTYNTKQMSNLIDLLVQDCREQEIETLTPQQLKELTDRWQNTN